MFDVCRTPPVEDGPEVRTSKSKAVPPQAAIAKLKEGNQRFVDGETQIVHEALAGHRKKFVKDGQKPMAAVFGCADSRAPLDQIFDAIPGDLFILRNAGNTCSRAEGSTVGSLEYAISALDTKLILVLGHTKCGAVAGATKTMLAQRAAGKSAQMEKGQSALEILLGGLVPCAEQAALQLPAGATEEQIATRAIQVNVFNTMSGLFQYSPAVRKMVQSGEVQVHGGIYNLETGMVEFLGEHPNQAALLQAHVDVTQCHDCAHDQFGPAAKVAA